MPLIGLVNPSHDERAADEPGRLSKWIPLEDLLPLAEDPPGGPKWAPWTYELIRAALEEWQERDYISCVSPGTPVLTAALEWVPAGKLQVGDELISVDEERVGRYRYMRTAVVISARTGANLSLRSFPSRRSSVTVVARAD